MPEFQTHFGDPCIHCGIPHDDVPVGPCTGDPKKEKPIAWCSLGVRWDKVEHYRIRWSTSRETECWSHIGNSLPYFHFGHSHRLAHPPPYDQTLERGQRRGH